MKAHQTVLLSVLLSLSLGLVGCPTDSPTSPEPTGSLLVATPSVPVVDPTDTPPSTVAPSPSVTPTPLLPPLGPCPEDDRDYDGDGIVCSRDCDERDPDIHPFATERCDGVDNDCDASIDEGFDSGCYQADGDGDGVSPAEGDCDDTNADISPMSPDRCDGVDNDCDGIVDNPTGEVTLYPDADGDGCGTVEGQFTFTRCDLENVSWQACDCDDGDASVNALADETCGDGVDNDCDGSTDEGFTADCRPDSDGDGFADEDDCDDDNPFANPGSVEQCDGGDNDCDGTIDEGSEPVCASVDDDGDGFTPYLGDCDDDEAQTHPGAAEICADRQDNDCDGSVDEDCLDADADGDGFTPSGGDCDDTDPEIHPGAADVCDGLDNNCSGEADEGLPQTCPAYGQDTDGDGVPRPEDCRDVDATIYPGAEEICDLVDNDCDQYTDEGAPGICDRDGDGFTVDAGDCNDNNPRVFPGAEERCNRIDDDCNGFVDDGACGESTPAPTDPPDLTPTPDPQVTPTEPLGPTPATPTPIDVTPEPTELPIDGCVDLSSVEICDDIDNDLDFVVDEGCIFGLLDPADLDGDCAPAVLDCDDLDPEVYPQADDLCSNGIDNDCDGIADENCPTNPWDFDGDGVYSPTFGGDDCDDLDAAVHPGADEICDGKDNDCDTLADEGLDDCGPPDLDGDGVDRPQDCDDTQADVNPGAPELCDCDDNDCDLQIDEGIPGCSCDPAHVPDRDGDGYTIPGGDCDDLDSGVNPGAAEVCGDAKDNNCDGVAEEGCLLCSNGGPGDHDLDDMTLCEGDCDDRDPVSYLDAPEICDAQDNDCDGVADEALGDTCDLTSGTGEDVDGDGQTLDDGDCNDYDASIYDGADELCDHKDNDCDLSVDEDLVDCQPPGTVDLDEDGYAPADNDCNDRDDTIHPDADDDCDRRDNDCDGTVDEDHIGPCPDIEAGAVDVDHDGVTISEGDCDDRDAATYPGAPELCDGKDNDCDGSADNDAPEPCDTSVDDDGDGSSEDEGDCDDGDPHTHQGAPELCDGKDNDCDGAAETPEQCPNQPEDPDDDGDTFTVGEGDCDDSDPTVNPAGIEVCDFVDNDCDGIIDEGFDPFCNALDDRDFDGYAASQGDCDDLDASIHPGAEEFCDGRDNDCNGLADDGVAPPCERPEDVDGDGVSITADCDDNDAAVAPGKPEICDGKDNDCNGQADDGLGAACEPPIPPDADGDTFTIADGDCDDRDSSIHPGAEELCDRRDNDCDQIADEGFDEGTCPPEGGDCPAGQVLQPDCRAGDNPDSTPAVSCVATGEGDLDCDGFSIDEGDCDDTNVDIGPGVLEDICNATDNDCDGGVDEGLGCEDPEDADGDGFTQPEDCDDTDATQFPGNAETCDLQDNDCDGQADEGLAPDCGQDPGTDPEVDHDGDGQTISEGDCDDGDETIYLGAEELCDGKDNDCDGSSEEPGCESTTSVVDRDGDGYTLDEGDCNDYDAADYPGADERCDLDDNDCDGLADEGLSECPGGLADADDDGFNIHEGDCDDTDPSVNPDADETCDRADEDCDGQADEGLGADCGYPIDHDHDYDGYTQFEGDCDDQDSWAYPGAPELCDLMDNNCDGHADEGLGDSCDTSAGSDEDGDGWTVGEGDCDDLDPSANPSALEICDDRDNNCDGISDDGIEALCPFAPVDLTDRDEDGYTLDEGDCDDWDAASNPGVVEACDGRDNDCDGEADENLSGCDDPGDVDGDGDAVSEGDCDAHDPRVYEDGLEVCDQVDNDCDGHADEQLPWCGYGDDQDADHDDWSLLEGDCDDNDSATYPGAPEGCDRKDNDCDGQADEGLSACPENPATDQDDDTFTIVGGDCNDHDPLTYPRAPEICDKADNDCDGQADEGLDPGCEPTSGTGLDQDHDGWTVGEGDCNDLDASINPDRPDVCDGRDNDCSGQADDDDAYDCPTGADDDGDGVPVPEDCDDHNADVGSDDPEVCDGLDNDCDGTADEGLEGCHIVDPGDDDGDTWTVLEGDCDDNDPTVYPGAPEYCDRKDNDCDRITDEDPVEICPSPPDIDFDRDGFTVEAGDCDDTDPTTHPHAPETCDRADDDCDQLVDEGLSDCPPDVSPDDDEDQFTIAEGDCNDGDDEVYPGAPELCDLKDNDCDGYHDESPTGSCDQDNDGYSVWDGDCDDSEFLVHPDAIEACNGQDDDCDAFVDEDAEGPCDVDGDGYSASDGSVTLPGDDCDDTDPLTHPDAEEVCDLKNNDCDRSVDEDTAEACDYDGDGYTEFEGCLDYQQNPVENPSTDYCDCAPLDAESYPGAVEICDYLNNDCDNSTDEGLIEYDGETFDISMCNSQFDHDQDGHYVFLEDDDGELVLNDNGGLILDDCNDTDATIYVGAEEICDLKDNDCDQSVDEGDWGIDDTYSDVFFEIVCELEEAPEACADIDDLNIQRCSYDYDGDGFEPIVVDDDGFPTIVDCNDLDATVNPEAPEICDEKDNDCDGPVDEGFYTCDDDFDGDGYGIVDGDCDDFDANVYPGALEICDRKDNNCDGKVGDYDDDDGDGYVPCTGDCDDTDPGVYAFNDNEQWYHLDDFKDADCDEAINPPACDESKTIPVIDVPLVGGCAASEESGLHVDLEVVVLDFCDDDCDVSPEVVFEVRNHGTDASPSNLKASIYGEKADGTFEHLTDVTLPSVAGGKSSGGIRVVTVAHIVDLYAYKAMVVTADHYDGAPPNGDLQECNEVNNRSRGFVHHVQCQDPICDLDSPVPGYQVTEVNEGCTYDPPIGPFDTEVVWNIGSQRPFPDYEAYRNVRVAIVAGNLTDDNCDGRIDALDVPDIAFTSYKSSTDSGTGVLRVVSGDDGHQIASYYGVGAIHGVALADANADGRPELYTGDPSGGGADLLSFDLNTNGCGQGITGELVLRWDSPCNTDAVGAAYPAVGDINGDGRAEIVHGYGVCDANGNLISRMSLFHRWTPSFADLDQDGYMEVISGAGVSRASDGTTVWQGQGGDGVVANMDGDPGPEIVGVYSPKGQISLYDTNGSVIWRVGMPGGRGGPPTIADFDKDGQMEIGVAGYNRYVVMETNGDTLWQHEIDDWSSGCTGSSVFDFEGDGRAEAVQADHENVWVFDGRGLGWSPSSGDIQSRVLLKETGHASLTRREYPLILDVDQDGHVEIVVAEDNRGWPGRTGITMLQDVNDSWVSGLRVWNQHAFHITNINDDLTVPANEEPHWQVRAEGRGNNTFRQGGASDRDLAQAAPDLRISTDQDRRDGDPESLSVCTDTCPAGYARVLFTIENWGANTVAPGLNWSVYGISSGGGRTFLTSGMVTVPIPAGESAPTQEAQIVTAWMNNYDRFAIVANDNNGQTTYNECDDQNAALNEIVLAVSCN